MPRSGRSLAFGNQGFGSLKASPMPSRRSENCAGNRRSVHLIGTACASPGGLTTNAAGDRLAPWIAGEFGIRAVSTSTFMRPRLAQAARAELIADRLDSVAGLRPMRLEAGSLC